MKQRLFKTKIKLKRIVANIIYLYRIKRQARQYSKGRNPRRKYDSGLHLTSYACDMYLHKGFVFWQIITKIKRNRFDCILSLITETINEAYYDGFLSDDEFILSLRTTKRFFLLAKKYLFIYNIM